MVSYTAIISHQAVARTKASSFCLVNDLLNNINKLSSLRSGGTKLRNQF